MTEEETSPPVKQPKSKNGIFVDDEPDITLTFTNILEYEGFEVDLYNDPQLALSSFRAGTYDTALIDIK
jgi:DNA-binding response OmpR family regulator